LKYVSIPADFLYNLPTKSTAHLNDIRFLELPLKHCTQLILVLDKTKFVCGQYNFGFAALKRIIVCGQHGFGL